MLRVRIIDQQDIKMIGSSMEFSGVEDGVILKMILPYNYRKFVSHSLIWLELEIPDGRVARISDYQIRIEYGGNPEDDVIVVFQGAKAGFMRSPKWFRVKNEFEEHADCVVPLPHILTEVKSESKLGACILVVGRFTSKNEILIIEERDRFVEKKVRDPWSAPYYLFFSGRYLWKILS